MYIISHKNVFITYHTCIYIYEASCANNTWYQMYNGSNSISNTLYIYHMFYESNILYITYIIITCWWWFPPTRCNKKTCTILSVRSRQLCRTQFGYSSHHHGTLATQYCCLCSLLFFFSKEKSELQFLHHSFVVRANDVFPHQKSIAPQ